jgi:hypothetical protein
LVKINTYTLFKMKKYSYSLFKMYNRLLLKIIDFGSK